MPSTAALRAHVESALGKHLSSTLLLRERTAPLTVSTGLASLDALTGGWPRGGLSEISGPASSGRTGVMLATLAGATRREEACALVDASDNFDPASAAAAGVDLDRLLWIRCGKHDRSSLRKGQQRAALGRLEQVLKVTDLLLQGGGFGMVVLDLGDIPVESVRRVPLTSWFRFRRAVEPTDLRVAGGAAAKNGNTRVRSDRRSSSRIARMEGFEPGDICNSTGGCGEPCVAVTGYAVACRGITFLGATQAHALGGRQLRIARCVVIAGLA